MCLGDRGNVVLWDAGRPHLLTNTSLLPHSVCVVVNRKLCKSEKYSDMSSYCCGPDGPHADLLVSLHNLLQAGYGWELQLRLP